MKNSIRGYLLVLLLVDMTAYGAGRHGGSATALQYELKGWSLFETVTTKLFGSKEEAVPRVDYHVKEQGASKCGAGGKNYANTVYDKDGRVVTMGHWYYC